MSSDSEIGACVHHTLIFCEICQLQQLAQTHPAYGVNQGKYLCKSSGVFSSLKRYSIRNRLFNWKAEGDSGKRLCITKLGVVLVQESLTKILSGLWGKQNTTEVYNVVLLMLWQ